MSDNLKLKTISLVKDCKLCIYNVFIHKYILEDLITKLKRFEISVYEPKLEQTNTETCIGILDYYYNSEFVSLQAQLNRDDIDINDIDHFLTRRYYFDSKEIFLPVIHITLFDLFMDENHEKVIPKCAPRFIKYTDHSIWNHYLPLYKITKASLIENKVLSELHRIMYSVQIMRDRYKFTISHEFEEIHSRLLKNSYLIGKGHGQHVSPFVFHSESRALNKARRNECHASVLSDKKWRFLLVDDYANRSMKHWQETALSDEVNMISKIVPNSKLSVVIENLRALFPEVEIACNFFQPTLANSKHERHINISHSVNSDSFSKQDFNIAITCVNCREDALKALKLIRFDVILLDYLLGEKSDGSREYSYELLNDIKIMKHSQNEEIEPGPNGRFFVMHISAYPSAIAERCKEQGIIYNTDYWYIGPGACPVNTPNMFLFLLHSLMSKRLLQMKFKNSNSYTLIDLMLCVFRGKITNTRYNAVVNFNAFLHMKANYAKLEKDYTYKGSKLNGSLLVQSLFPDIEFYDNHFWAHLQHLMYLVAFGNVGQWSAIWDDFMCVKKNLHKADESGEVVGLIENYIVSLREYS